MGNSQPLIDKRVIQAKDTLQLTSKDIQKFWNIFCKYDRDMEGAITLDVFFFDILGEPSRNEFGDSIFEFIESDEKNLIHFGEFVQACCTFAMFQIKDMSKFVFWLFDKEKTGSIEKEEFEFFIEKIHNGIKGNIQSALNNVVYDDDELLTYESFQSFIKCHPGTLFPMFRLQQSIKCRIMGNSWWEGKLKALHNDRLSLNDRSEKNRKKEENRLRRERRRILQSQMGLYAYFMNKERRKHFEQIHPLPIVYLDENLDVRVQYESVSKSH